jgi:hypothetical protein
VIFPSSSPDRTSAPTYLHALFSLHASLVDSNCLFLNGVLVRAQPSPALPCPALTQSLPPLLAVAITLLLLPYVPLNLHSKLILDLQPSIA